MIKVPSFLEDGQAIQGGEEEDDDRSAIDSTPGQDILPPSSDSSAREKRLHSGQRNTLLPDEPTDVDARRMRRLQQRAEERAAAKKQATVESQKLRERSSTVRINKRVPLSAAIAIDCRNERPAREKVESPDLHWFACKVVLKGIV
ncbi:hypothetical protein CBS101457_002120 [Exobasidium rhododendri]|nr:hypothetical protein CBS101457_002120 [Exobasidium rhododendri]